MITLAECHDATTLQSGVRHLLNNATLTAVAPSNAVQGGSQSRGIVEPPRSSFSVTIEPHPYLVFRIER